MPLFAEIPSRVLGFLRYKKRSLYESQQLDTTLCGKVVGIIEPFSPERSISPWKERGEAYKTQEKTARLTNELFREQEETGGAVHRVAKKWRGMSRHFLPDGDGPRGHESLMML